MALFAASYEVGGGYPDDFVDVRDKGSRNGGKGNQKLDNSQYEALLEGGEQVTSVLQEMITIVSFSAPIFF